jgi:hypothetical protein
MKENTRCLRKIDSELHCIALHRPIDPIPGFKDLIPLSP